MAVSGHQIAGKLPGVFDTRHLFAARHRAVARASMAVLTFAVLMDDAALFEE